MAEHAKIQHGITDEKEPEGVTILEDAESSAVNMEPEQASRGGLDCNPSNIDVLSKVVSYFPKPQQVVAERGSIPEQPTFKGNRQTRRNADVKSSEGSHIKNNSG
ncbi:hypothetical protein KM043_004796 [Ampulex compressa]|nr:hypothetical protein KM043_004796 [Ampulex compressa]